MKPAYKEGLYKIKVGSKESPETVTRRGDLFNYKGISLGVTDEWFDSWNVTHIATGLAMARDAKSRAQAVKKAMNVIDKYGVTEIKRLIKKYKQAYEETK